MRIKEAAERYKTTKRTLRYYEEIGLIKSSREQWSNYRVYSVNELNKLEVIFLLKEIGFTLSDISEIFARDRYEDVEKIFTVKSELLWKEINSLRVKRDVMKSILKILKSGNSEELNLQEIFKEQIYFDDKVERIVNMSQFIKDDIVLEFGEGIVPYAEKIIYDIRRLREEISEKYEKEFPLVRVRDVEELENEEFRITMRGVIVRCGSLESKEECERAQSIINIFREVIIQNLELILN